MFYDQNFLFLMISYFQVLILCCTNLKELEERFFEDNLHSKTWSCFRHCCIGPNIELLLLFSKRWNNSCNLIVSHSV